MLIIVLHLCNSGATKGMNDVSVVSCSSIVPVTIHCDINEAVEREANGRKEQQVRHGDFLKVAGTDVVTKPRSTNAPTPM